MSSCAAVGYCWQFLCCMFFSPSYFQVGSRILLWMCFMSVCVDFFPLPRNWTVKNFDVSIVKWQIGLCTRQTNEQTNARKKERTIGHKLLLTGKNCHKELLRCFLRFGTNIWWCHKEQEICGNLLILGILQDLEKIQRRIKKSPTFSESQENYENLRGLKLYHILQKER